MKRHDAPQTATTLSRLLDHCAQGDRAAFKQVYQLTSRRVFGIVLTILRDRAIAEDITQDVYVQIWRYAQRRDLPHSNASAWIATIARNKAIDRLRTDRVRGFVTFTDDLPDVVELAPADRLRAEAMDVRRALTAIKPEYRKVLLLSYFRGYTQTELAELLDTPLGTIKSWMTRGMADLREALK